MTATSMYTARGTLDHSETIERYGPMVRRVASQLIARLPANVELDDMGMVESLHLCAFHWVLNDVFARINSEGRFAAAAS